MKRETKAANGIYGRFVKRFLDIVLSACGLIVLSPVYLILSVWIKLDSPGPILFRQNRIGKDKTHFDILKFRTMRTDAPKDVPTHLLTDPEQWTTRAGRFMRRTSLDELPQIWNIFVGQMSVIGPRPALWNQFDLIEERDKVGANDVRPGLTGWAQINGRDELDSITKAHFDGEYVQRLSFAFDAKCFFGTIFPVLRGDGVIEGGVAQQEKTKSESEPHDSKTE
jgi:O-antigen biosynthesis protein WbqP